MDAIRPKWWFDGGKRILTNKPTILYKAKDTTKIINNDDC